MADRMVRRVLEVSIGGAVPERRPSSFRLRTDRDCHSTIASLEFPPDADVGGKGDPVTVHLSADGRRSLLFTGEIFSVQDMGSLRKVWLADGYAKLCNASVNAAYRKETATAILKDALDAAGIEKTAITCPDVEVARFSTGTVFADRLIEILVGTLAEHGHRGIRFFFDETDTFHFGTSGDAGRNPGETREFKTGANIVAKGDGWIETLPLPIRHSTRAVVDGRKLWVRATELRVSGTTSRLRLWLSEAA